MGKKDETISVGVSHIDISIDINKEKADFLRDAKFDGVCDEYLGKTPDEYSNEEKAMLMKLASTGLMYSVIDWENQDVIYFLTDVGKAVKKSLEE